MNDALLGTIAVTGFSVAFLHAALPTHWLPFVLAGRGQNWSPARTLTITALAGGGHVLFTVLLGVLVVWFGIAVERWTGGVLPWLASAALILFGLYYWFRGGHHHHDHDHDHAHGLAPAAAKPSAPARDDFAVILGLVTALTFSPCEGFLPVFVAGASFGWWGFLVLCLILVLGTLAGMLLLTALSLRGLQHLKLDTLARFEGRILGAVLMALGLAVIALEF